MARGRPKKRPDSNGPERLIRMNGELYDKVNMLSELHGLSNSDLLDQLLRPVIDAECAKHATLMAKMQSLKAELLALRGSM